MTVLGVLVAVPAIAQTPGKNELSVFGGISLLDASTTNSITPLLLDALPSIGTLVYPPILGTSRKLGSSGEFGVRYGREATETITVTGDFSVAPAHELSNRLSSGCPEPLACIAAQAEGSIGIGFEGGVPVGFPFPIPDVLFSERVVAYHYGGGLRLHVLPTSTLKPAVVAGIGGVTYAGTRRRESQFVLRIGGSITASVRNLSTTIEVLDAIVPDHYVSDNVEHDVHIRIAFGVHW